MRVMEVRRAYAADDFEWDTTRKITGKKMEEANERILREVFLASMKRNQELHGACFESATTGGGSESEDESTSAEE